MEERRQPIGLHQDLEDSKQEIRLTRMLPALDLDDPIHVELFTVSLLDEPHYEAISYAWGNCNDTVDISLQVARPTSSDGLRVFKVPITASLWRALRRLRLKEQPRTLWADALCIDQKNIEEKNKQVPMMGEIYGAADRVNVWLGEDESPLTKLWRDSCLHDYAEGNDGWEAACAE